MSVSADERRRYEAVEEFLTDEERERIEGYRVRSERGEDGGMYGHDLIAAIRRGHRNRARELADACMDRMILANTTGDDSPRQPDAYYTADEKHARNQRLAYAGALSVLIDAAAARGVPADKLRMFLVSRAEARDSTSIERRVEKALDGA